MYVPREQEIYRRIYMVELLLIVFDAAAALVGIRFAKPTRGYTQMKKLHANEKGGNVLLCFKYLLFYVFA